MSELPFAQRAVRLPWLAALLLLFSGVGALLFFLSSQQRSGEWTPVVRDFDGVLMVQVPVGCFMMGSADGGDDEQPQVQRCFAQPFWIDQTEVTQADFVRRGGQRAWFAEFTGDERPINAVTWSEAAAFCALRGARLPTEAEWEYAARGPNSRLYPWGDAWDPALAVWNRDPEQGAAAVGSLPGGASWVGAFDMSGNVWEWVSSRYLPYDSAEEREAPDDPDAQRVRRGGGWNADEPALLDSANRRPTNPDSATSFDGFRCARDG